MPARLLIAALLVFTAGCTAHGTSASRKYASAPRLENPTVGQAQVGVPGMTNDPVAFVFSAFDGRQVCFDGENTQSPGEASATRYSLRVLNTDDADLSVAPTLKQSVVRVLGSQSTLVPVTRTVQDTVRDRNGNTIATVSRQVQELETEYQTQLRICFPGAPTVLGPQARFMVMLREGATGGGWGFRMGPRPYWVWRFPAADQGPAPVAAPAQGQPAARKVATTAQY
jgi:hypothetical protein